MTAADYVEFLIQKGFSLEVSGDRLRVSPAKALPREMVDSLARFKAEIISALLLRQPCQRHQICSVPEKQNESVDGLIRKCPRCGSPEYIDVAIHEGQSRRRDCRRCHRFIGWPLWYGRPDPQLAEVKP